MEVSDNSSVEVVSTSDTGSSAAEMPKVTESTANPGVIPAAEPAEWKPNFKVKAYDREFEIPENFRSFINKENEKDFKDTFEKSFALDVMKEKNAKIRELNDSYQARIEKEYEPKIQRYGKLESYLSKKDFDSFFEKAGVAEVELQKWMLKKLQLRDLPPDQQALYNDHRAAQQRAEALEEENNSYKQKYEQLNESQRNAEVTHRLKELDDVVNSPEIAEIAKNFDTRLGQDGSFKLEVLRRAAVVSKQLNRELTVPEAVNEYLRVIGQTPGNSQVSEGASQAQPKPAYLPSLSGKATSPAQQKIKTLDDLKKLSKQVIASASKSSRE